MTAIAVDPIVLKNCTFKVGTDSYEAATSAVTFVPTVATSTVTFKGLTPAASFSFPTSTPSEWVCNIEYAQDWVTATSLANYLHTNEGNTVAVEFVPEAGSAMPKFTADVTIAPGQIGGTVDQVATSSVSLGCTKPVKGTTV